MTRLACEASLAKKIKLPITKLPHKESYTATKCELYRALDAYI